jgi:hypothetical protein
LLDLECATMKTALALLLLLAVVAQAPAGSPRDSYTAPDSKLRAFVYKAPGAAHGIHVDVYERGEQVTGWLHSAGSAQNPARLLHAAWSPDSRFFVYTVSRSAPTSPRFDTFVFVRSRARIYDLSRFVQGTIIDSRVSLSKPCRFQTRRVAANGKVENFEIELSSIEWPEI